MRLNLSYSSLELFHSCPRKYELSKLVQGVDYDEQSLDLVAGTSFDRGLSALLEGKTLEQAVEAAYFAWTFPNGIERQSVGIAESSKKKAFYLVVAHLEKFYLDRPSELYGWQLATLPNGKQATQVSFKIALPYGRFYRGHIDAILFNPEENMYAALEVKTTGLKNAPASLYQNSAQGQSYAMITDYIFKQNGILQLFLAAEFPEVRQQVFPFYRNVDDKVSWLPSLALDMQVMEAYMQAQHFPMRGKSCYEYYRDCKFLGICNLPRHQEYKEHAEEPDENYMFNFTLEELLQAKEELY